MFHQKLYLYHGTNHQVDEENRTLYLDHKMLRSLGLDQVKVHGSIDFNTSKMVVGVSCAHICIIVSSGYNFGIKPS
jgi:hypothetical protein